LLAPTTIYVKAILQLLREQSVHGMAHITGGGLTENIIRVVPDELGLSIDTSTWKLPAVFDWLQREGNVAHAEMWRTFNCGIGYTVIVAKDAVASTLANLNALQLHAMQIGEITRNGGADRVYIR
jgi:phosphoribosylformylglycinamidine cyclo-ligase